MTRVEPSFSDGWVFNFRGSAIAADGLWDQGRKSELLFGEPLSSATMTCRSLLLRARWSVILGWIVGVLPWEVGAAGCFAATLGNDDSW